LNGEIKNRRNYSPDFKMTEQKIYLLINFVLLVAKLLRKIYIWINFVPLLARLLQEIFILQVVIKLLLLKN